MTITSPNLKPGQLHLTPYRPWRRMMIVLAFVLVSVAFLVAGFGLGYNEKIAQRISATLLSQDLDGANAQAQDLQNQLIDAQLSAEVNSAAVNQLRTDLTDLRGTNERLEQELIFYKSLMAPSALRKGLQVAEFEIRPLQLDLQGADDHSSTHYQFELLLTQVAVRRSFIAGNARIDLIGQLAEGEAVLSLTELADLETYPLKFRFRFFQDLSGQISLPADFSPEKVLVTIEQKGKEPIQASFPWTT